MPAKPAWFTRLPEITQEIRLLEVPVFDRALIEKLFHIRRRRAIDLLHTFGGYQSGKTFLIDRQRLLAEVEQLLDSPDYRQSKKRRDRLVSSLEQLRRVHAATEVKLTPLPAASPAARILPKGIDLQPGRLTVSFQSAEDLLSKLYGLAQRAAQDYEGFRTTVEGDVTVG